MEYKEAQIYSAHIDELSNQTMSMQSKMIKSAEVPVKDAFNLADTDHYNSIEGKANDKDFMNKVLIIDDEPMNSEVLTSLLQVENVDAETQISGVKALEHLAELIFRKKPIYKVILIDFCMQELDGPQTAIQIRELC